MTVVANAANLAAVHHFVRAVSAESSGFRGEALQRLDLVVEESFLNIAMHACPGETVEVECAGETGSVTVVFRYPGPAFDPTGADAPEPDLEAPLAERRIGGLGIYLTRALARSVHYRREGSINCLTLRVE